MQTRRPTLEPLEKCLRNLTEVIGDLHFHTLDQPTDTSLGLRS